MIYPTIIDVRLAMTSEPFIISDSIFRGIRGGLGSVLKIEVMIKPVDLQIYNSTFVDIETRDGGIIYF